MLLIFAKIVCAAVGYTIGTVGIRKKGLTAFAAGFFSAAFIFDIWATYEMRALGVSGHLSIHALMGLTAIIFAAIMQIAILIGIQDQIYKDQAVAFFRRMSYWFLGVWFTAVFLGIEAAALRHAAAIHGF